MNDALMDGRQFRLYNVVNDFNRAEFAIVVDTNIQAHRADRTTERLRTERDYPALIRSGKRPEVKE